MPDLVSLLHANPYPKKFLGQEFLKHMENRGLDLSVPLGKVVARVGELADYKKFEEPELFEKVKEGVLKGFLELDEKLRKIPEVTNGEDKSGTTAVCALIR